jgi:thiamine biosynthesis protein ThiC
VQVARGRAIIPANKRHLELEPTIIGEGGRENRSACKSAAEGAQQSTSLMVTACMRACSSLAQQQSPIDLAEYTVY